MKKFSIKLDELIGHAIERLNKKIRSKGVESDYSSNMCLKIKNDDCMFNLEGGRYLTEIRTDRYYDQIELVDNSGYTYHYSVLETLDFLEVIDHLLEVY